MPKKPVKKTKAQQDAQLRQEIEALKRSLGIDKPPVGGPGANDQELYPTDRGHVDFRLAKGKKKKRGGQSYA